MTDGVDEYVERFGRIIEPVADHPGAEPFDPGALRGQFLRGGHAEVEVQLLGPPGSGQLGAW